MNLRLIIEVDGLTHDWEETIIKDKKKDADLKEAGFIVLRFTDNEVLQHMNAVVMQIENTIADIESNQAAPQV